MTGVYFRARPWGRMCAHTACQRTPAEVSAYGHSPSCQRAQEEARARAAAKPMSVPEGNGFWQADPGFRMVRSEWYTLPRCPSADERGEQCLGVSGHTGFCQFAAPPPEQAPGAKLAGLCRGCGLPHLQFGDRCSRCRGYATHREAALAADRWLSQQGTDWREMAKVAGWTRGFHGFECHGCGKAGSTWWALRGGSRTLLGQCDTCMEREVTRLGGGE